MKEAAETVSIVDDDQKARVKCQPGDGHQPIESEYCEATDQSESRWWAQ